MVKAEVEESLVVMVMARDSWMLMAVVMAVVGEYRHRTLLLHLAQIGQTKTKMMARKLPVVVAVA